MPRLSIPLVLIAHLAAADLPAAVLPRLLEGYTAEVVAEAPLVKHPMMGCFDDRGRLYIAESAGTNRKAQDLIDDPQDSIRLLEDSDGDGVFDQSTVFADKLTFPQGVLWHRGIVYTCAPPYVWKLEDTDADGVADQRTILVKSFGFNGNAASIHGPFLGPDERLYWCDGRHGHEFHDESGQVVSKGKAARIFSCRLDGSDVRTLAGGGMDNPVEIDWLPSGELVGTVNLFYGRPRGDVLVHWVEGGVYPRFDQQDCIDEFTWTGDVLPEIHNYGHVAVSGMCRERTGRVPDDEAVGSVLVTQFNTHKVVRTVLGRDRSTLRAIRHEELAVWEDPDVHPTDVLEAPDGSILVIDTGGWFRIGCPTSQIAKPEIPGAIYRIRRAPEQDLPAERSETAIGPTEPEEARLWLSLGDDVQRLAAAQKIAQVFAGPSAAAKGLDHQKFARSVIEAVREADSQRHLTHSLVLALIRIGDAETARAALADDSPAARRAALIALDQMEGGTLTEEEVTALLDAGNPQLLEVVLDVIGRREGWVAETVPMFRKWLLSNQPPERRIDAMEAFFLAQADDLWVQELVADGLSQKKTHPAIRHMLIEVIARAELETVPLQWAQALQVPLGLRSDPESRLAAIRAIGSRALHEHDQWLLEIAEHPEEDPLARGEAFAALAPRLETAPVELFGFAMHQLTSETDLLARLTIARGLASTELDEAQLLVLAESLARIGPEVVPVLLPTFSRSSSMRVGEALIGAMEQMGNALSLSPQELETLLKNYPKGLRSKAAPLFQRLETDQLERVQRLDHLAEATVTDGDAGRGRSIFFGQAAGCSVCHRVGGEGGEIGPALTNIGAIRQSRDLLEAIAFPSATFAREYRPYVIVTEDGRIYSGIVSSTTSDSVIIRTTDLKEIRVPRSSIEEMRQSDTSIMPGGLDTKLSTDELRDLLAYLQSLQGDSP